MTSRTPNFTACVVAMTVAACGRLGYENLQIEAADADVDAVGLDGTGGPPISKDADPGVVGAFDASVMIDVEAQPDAGPQLDVSVGKDAAAKLDAAPKLDAAAKQDAAVPGLPDCVQVMKTWTAMFDADPTKTDLNKDGVKDWSPARGSFAASQIQNGQWLPSASVALLDTAPLSNFATRTIFAVEMQHIEYLYPQTNNLGGAIAWLNLDNQTTNGLAVYLRLVRVSPTQQTLYLMDNAVVAPMATFTVSGGLQEMTLDVNPKTSKARLWLGSTYKGEWTLPRTGTGPNSDAYATVGTFFGSAVFDNVYIEQCVE